MNHFRYWYRSSTCIAQSCPWYHSNQPNSRIIVGLEVTFPPDLRPISSIVGGLDPGPKVASPVLLAEIPTVCKGCYASVGFNIITGVVQIVVSILYAVWRSRGQAKCCILDRNNSTKMFFYQSIPCIANRSSRACLNLITEEGWIICYKLSFRITEFMLPTGH